MITLASIFTLMIKVWLTVFHIFLYGRFHLGPECHVTAYANYCLSAQEALTLCIKQHARPKRTNRHNALISHALFW